MSKSVYAPLPQLEDVENQIATKKDPLLGNTAWTTRRKLRFGSGIIVLLGVVAAAVTVFQSQVTSSLPEKYILLKRQDPSPTYSTTTYTNGATSTFVFTTRPIVNPGGYTIGTLTGYVPLSTTTASPAALEERSPVEEEGSGSESPTYSTTTYPNGQTSTFVFTTRPIVNPGGYTIGTLTGYVPLRPTTQTTSSDETEGSPTQSASTTTTSTTTTTTTTTTTYIEETSIIEETTVTVTKIPDNFVQETTTIPAESPTYSTTVNSKGETSTYVFTTRPIVNPGGYTIGTLTGYVPIPTTTTTTLDEQPTETCSQGGPTSEAISVPEAKRLVKRGSFENQAGSHEDILSDEAVGSSVEEVKEPAITSEESSNTKEPTTITQESTRTSTISSVMDTTQAPSKVEEFSYSIDRSGKTLIFVRTTRPILNPIGYTIGTLSGAYVRVYSTSSSYPWPHQELKRKRNEVKLNM